MHEVLFSPTELPSASEHPMIQRVEVPSMSPTVAALKDPFLVDPVIDVRSSRYNFTSDPRSGTEKESA